MTKYKFWIVSLSAMLVGCSAPDADSSPRPTVATLFELDLREPLPEQTAALFSHSRASLYDARTKVRSLLEEPLAKGLFVRLGPLHGRFSDLAEWAAAFDEYRAQHKPVHCHFDAADNLAVALASHCDRVSMTPSGMVELVGLAAQLVHGRELLASLGVQADLLQIGKYKGAAEPFTRDAPSEPLLESIQGMLDDLDRTFQDHLGKGGARTPEQVHTLIADGPYAAAQAKNAGLVDALIYDDEARADAKKAASAAAIRAIFPEHKDDLSLRELLDALGKDDDDDSTNDPRLAVAFLTGEIVDGDDHGQSSGASDPFVKALRSFADDTRVRAVVLRIESPGGSALASDRMWHAVRRAAARKPVIVSIGNMAASGGYYVASAGTHLLASEGSIVGSIGVVGGKMVLSELSQKIGVHVTTLPRAPHAGWLSPLAAFSESEKARLSQLLTTTYELFLKRVATGRNVPVEGILPGAEGRVMGGVRAKELGLIDEVGGLGRALTLAYEQGKLNQNAKVVQWPKAAGPLQKLTSLLGAHTSLLSGPLGEQLGRETDLAARGVLQSVLLKVLEGGRTRVATMLPYALIVR